MLRPNRALILVLSFALVTLCGCEPKKGAAADPAPAVPGAQLPVGDSSQTALDWHGTYQGVLPCADCEGIETVLTLRPDHSYTLEMTYLGKDSEPLQYQGSFAWTSDGQTIYLNDLDSEANRFFIGENFVAQLDIEGQRIEGEIGQKFELRKVELSPLAGSNWRLVELMGQPYTGSGEESQVPTLSFSLNAAEVSGQAPCNSFRGEYSWEQPDRLRFRNLLSTLRACPDLDKETEYLRVLSDADSYHLEGDTLQLFKARMAPLARFQRETESR